MPHVLSPQRTVCIVGAGAIGGFIGTRLAARGEVSVSALARGATLAALRSQGWRMQTAAGLEQGPMAKASESAAELGEHDVVFIALKAPALPALAPALKPLIGPHTLVVPAMNGVPWWFCQGQAAWGDAPLTSIDPNGSIAASLPYTQTLGCVVHASTQSAEPGVVLHKMGQGLIMGETNVKGQGLISDRVQQLVALLSRAGFDAKASENIRYDIWYKLWGNMTMNPISALTGAMSAAVMADELLRGFCSAAMREAAAIGARIGVPIAQTPEDRHAITRKLGSFKTSMLQDVQASRAIELDALVGVVHEIGTRLGEPMPAISALLGLTRVFARERGLYPPA